MLKRSAWLPLVLILALALPPLWYSLVATPALRLEVGRWPDETYLAGLHKPERNEDGTFRWTTDRAELALPNLSARYQLLRIHAHGWRPLGVAFPQVRVEVAGRLAGTFQPTRDLRSYDILLPRDQSSQAIRVSFISDTYVAPGDRRTLGFAIDWIELRGAGAPDGPTPLQLGGQLLLLGLALALIGMLALPRVWALAAGLAIAAALIGANLANPLWVAGALPGWLIVAGALAAATWLLAPRFRRALAPWMGPAASDAAWALLMAAAALRLLGATHPLFTIHDIGFHSLWLDVAIRGELYIYSAPSEFQNRAIFNPPAGYLLMAPLQLLMPSLRLTIQVAVALVDALGCLVLLALARELGLSARAGLLALATYVALPINTTMLWWGFATNDMAQTAGLLLIWALLRLVRRPDHVRLAVFCAAVVTCLLMHIGALVLTMGLLGATAALGWLRLAPAARRAVTGGTALALALTAILYFSAVVDPALAQPSAPADTAAQETPSAPAIDLPARLDLASRAPAIGLLPVGAALAPLGLLLLLRHPRAPAGVRGRLLSRALLLGWPAVCMAFFVVYLALGLFVRYVYFAAPLACLALGELLAALWPRRGRALVVALVLLIAWSGVALWTSGVLLGVKPSLVPLTH